MSPFLRFCLRGRVAKRRRKRIPITQSSPSKKIPFKQSSPPHLLVQKMGDGTMEVSCGKEDDTVLTRDEIEKDDDSVHVLPGIPLLPPSRNSKNGVIFVLEKAWLVPAYVGRNYKILNQEEHADFLRKKHLNPYDYRPDIIHEALLQIMGSPLCMGGGVQAIYIKTVQGVLIKVEPHTRIPDTLGAFCAMMSQLLLKLSIKARGKGEKLLRVIENPVTKHLPLNSHIIGLSYSAKKAVRIRDYVGTFRNDQTLVFVVGAMAHGKIECDYINDFVSVSSFPLSAATCLRRICIAVERFGSGIGKKMMHCSALGTLSHCSASGTLRRCSASGTKNKREGEAPILLEEANRKKSRQEDQDHSGDALPPVHLKPNFHGKAIFILENAALKKGFVRKRWKILNSEEDSDFLLRQKKNLDDYRPAIVHQALRAILDSPLNKAGMVGAIYVKINNGALFEVKPHVRLPRTLKRFCGLMLDLLDKSYACTRDTRETLLCVVDEPVTRYLPTHSRIIGISQHSKKLVDIERYISDASDDLNLVFVLSATVCGKIEQRTDDLISVSEYPLELQWCAGLTLAGFEEKWKIY